MSFDAFRDAVLGSLMMERQLDTVSNNLANVSTAGFRGDRVVFNDLMDRTVRTMHRQGSLKATGRPLDVALAGDGFFMVRTAQGDRLTRSGSFRLTAEGALVTPEGHQVLGEGRAPITLNPQGPQAHIDSKGGIYQGNEQVGKIGVFKVNDLKLLKKDGNTMFAGWLGQLPPTQEAQEYNVNQGYLEMANVQVVEEMVRMINTFRGFESYQKVIHTLGEMNSKATNQLGTVA